MTSKLSLKGSVSPLRSRLDGGAILFNSEHLSCQVFCRKTRPSVPSCFGRFWHVFCHPKKCDLSKHIAKCIDYIYWTRHFSTFCAGFGVCVRFQFILQNQYHYIKI